jgi:hypothetical protein
VAMASVGVRPEITASQVAPKVIWAAAAVTAAINAARVMVDAFNASLSVKETVERDGRSRDHRSVLSSFYHRSCPVSGAKGARRRLIPALPGK